MLKLSPIIAALSCLAFSANAELGTYYKKQLDNYISQNHDYRTWKPTDRIPWPWPNYPGRKPDQKQGITIENVQVEAKTGDLWVNIEAESDSGGTSNLPVVDVLSYANGLSIDCQDIDVDYPVAVIDARLNRGTLDFTTGNDTCDGDDPKISHIHVECKSDRQHKVEINVDFVEETPDDSTKGSIRVQQVSAVCSVTVTQGGVSVVLDDLEGGTLTRVRQ